MRQAEVNPMSIRMFTGSKVLFQLRRAPVYNAVLALQGAQSLVPGVPLTKPICGEMDQHETFSMFRQNSM